MDGRLVRTDAEREPDLFWAVRGGGGTVGVVTALELALVPVQELYGGVLFFPIERVSEVLRAWREWTDTVPDEVTSIGRVLRFPEFPEVPEPMRGRAFALVEAAYLGDARAGAELLRPLRELGPQLDTFATIAASMLQTLHMDPPAPVAGEGDGALLSDFPAGAVDALVSLAGPGVETPLSSVEVRHLGGALAREAAGGGAQARIDAAFLLFAAGLTPTPERRDAVHMSARALKDAVSAWRAGHDYYNLAETPAEARAVLPPAAYRRLREIKSRYDPRQAIISAHPVRPATRG
jgi:FAD/FMN-containing dehydrogenase